MSNTATKWILTPSTKKDWYEEASIVTHMIPPDSFTCYINLNSLFILVSNNQTYSYYFINIDQLSISTHSTAFKGNSRNSAIKAALEKGRKVYTFKSFNEFLLHHQDMEVT